MRKAYQTPVVEVTELDGDRHILLVANSLPGASELPSDNEQGTQPNVNIWDDIW